MHRSVNNVKSSVRRGFTLVELLIVIVVIGVLSAMMMLSSTEAVSSAKAAVIINDLQQLKRAVRMWYLDHMDELGIDPNNNYQWMGTVGRFYYKKDNKYYDYSVYKNIENFARSEGGSQAILQYLNNPLNMPFQIGDGWEKGNYRVFSKGANNTAYQDSKNQHEWYVGYLFRDGEGEVFKKVLGREKTAGLICYGNGDRKAPQVWLYVLDLKGDS